VWFAYVDESYNDSHHWVVAVLIEHTRVNETQRAIRAVVAESAAAYGIRADSEIHGHQIFHGEGDFAPMKALVRARIGIYADVFRCLVNAGCWIILRGVSKPHLVDRYAYPEHISSSASMNSLGHSITPCLSPTNTTRHRAHFSGI
jgi:hypothetical protein